LFGFRSVGYTDLVEIRVKLNILADAAKYDASCASSGSKRSGREGALGNTTKVGICHSYTPDGRCVSLLKILLTNYCIYDCQYCVNRVTSDVPRARFSVDEVVWLTMEFYRRNYIEGLFLSSGIIKSVDYTMEQLIAVAKKLRVEQQYNGYIHLKAVPNASPELLAEAGKWADRLSANVELPTEVDLKQLAPQKKLPEIDATMATLAEKIAESREARAKSRVAPAFAPGGQSTQMIVGATPTPDAQILNTASTLYAKHKLRRVYYSAFSPIPHADFRLSVQPPPLVREHRLYQADWLMRFYGFDAAELTTPDQTNLDLQVDPKLSWALRHRDQFPIDLNKAPKARLLRIPGLGVRNVNRILGVRRFHKIRLDDLRKLRVSLPKVRPWVITADHNPDVHRLDRDDLRARIVKPTRQLELFDTQQSALSGEV
jgi:putative DNA modification/repair radical SAM protein